MLPAPLALIAEITHRCPENSGRGLSATANGLTGQILGLTLSVVSKGKRREHIDEVCAGSDQSSVEATSGEDQARLPLGS